MHDESINLYKARKRTARTGGFKKAQSGVPNARIFATEASTIAALQRIAEILETREANARDLPLLVAGIVINPEHFPRIKGKTSFETYNVYINVLTQRLLAASKAQAIAGIHALGAALRYELRLGWLSLDKTAPLHHSISIFRKLSERAELRDAIAQELEETVLSPSPIIPIDARGEAGDLLIELRASSSNAKLAARLRSVLNSFPPLPVKSMRAHLLVGTDTIDTPFEFPGSSSARIKLIWNAAAIKTRERVFVDAMRIANALGLKTNHAAKLARISEICGEYLTNPEGEKFIRERITSKLRRVEDYIVDPNQMLGTHTVSDLTRIFSLCPESYWPDREVRTVWTAFARSVLGFCRVASIGLGSPMIYIPHGVDVASLVFVGQATVIGRGANLDLTGGLLIGRRNYTSAFWSDCDIHGHLHNGDQQRGEGGTLSRLTIEPYVLILDDDVAFPPGIGYVEGAHYAAGQPKEGSIRGFRVVPATRKRLVADLG